MIKIDLEKGFKELDGRDICDDVEQTKPVLMWKLLAHRLSSETKPFDAMKFWDWSLDLHSKDKKVLEVDESDFKNLRNWIEKELQLPVILKAPLLKVFDTAKEFSIK